MKRNFTQLFMGAMLILSFSVQAQDSLFISEVIDPADDYSGRFIELYNAGSEAVDFSTSTIYLSRQSNGGTSWGDLQLSGSVDPGSTFVIGGSGFEALYGFSPDQETGILIGNGDDAYALFTGGDHETGILHDILGVLDVDGTGEPWEYEDARALRVASVLSPNATWTATEWEISQADVTDGDPGTHNGSVPLDPPGDYAFVLLNDTVDWGEPVVVPVWAGGLSVEDNIISYQFRISYDPLVLAYAGFTLAGSIADGGTAVVNAETAGELIVGYMNSTALSGAGEILKLQFNALLMDTTGLQISDAYLNNAPVEDVEGGTVIITESAPPTAAITYSDTLNRFADTLIITASFSEAMDAENAVLLSMEGAWNISDLEMIRQTETLYTFPFPIPKASGTVSLVLSNGTDLRGNEVVPLPTAGATFDIIEFVAGDVDDDGQILAYDAALVLQYSVGMDPLPAMDPLPWENWRDSTANVDATGGITAHDAGLILQYSAGIISDFGATSLKASSLAGISMEVEDRHMVFYSHGELLGFNLDAENKQGILGVPVLLNEEYMSAVNMTGGNCRVGLCTAFPAQDGTPMLKIPILSEGTITLHMMENTKAHILKLELATSLEEFGERFIELYPNPVTDKLHVSGLDGRIRGAIFSIHGQLCSTFDMEGCSLPVDVSGLAPGIYMLRLDVKGKSLVKKFRKQ